MNASGDPVAALEAAAESGDLPPGVPLLVACSGGLDSMSLVHALRVVDRWPITVATVDHGLHPESASHASFVAQVLVPVGIDVEVLVADPELVRVGQGPEDAARRERYRLLERCAARRGVRHVLTAHTADDQAETALMRLALGAGSRGMAGIPPRRGIFVRPWLRVARAAVSEFAAERAVEWREDPTNDEDRFLRNRLRQQVGPALAEVFGPSWIAAAARTASHLRSDLDAQDFLLARWREEIVKTRADGVHIELSSFGQAPAALRAILLRDALCEAARVAGAPAARDLSTHIALVDGLATTGGAGRALDLPGGLQAERGYGRLRIGAPAAPRSASPLLDVVVDGPGSYAWGGWSFAVEPVVGLPPPGLRADGCVARAAAPFPWSLRRARAGERFRPLGAPGSKRVSRLWTDARVPRGVRSELPVLESAERLVWVAALRVAHAARLQADEPGWRITFSAEDGRAFPWERTAE